MNTEEFADLNKIPRDYRIAWLVKLSGMDFYIYGYNEGIKIYREDGIRINSIYKLPPSFLDYVLELEYLDGW